MANRDYKLANLESFSGGLNLRSDQFDLASNESPDLLNVTVDPRGGVAMRSGVMRRNPTALGADIKGIFGFHTDSGTNQVIVNQGTQVLHSAANDFTNMSNITARTAGSRVYGATFNNVAYGVSYDKPSFRWDGTTDADLGSATDGSDLNMPQAQYIAVWNNFVFVANTYEGSTAHKNRVRWSNANDAQKWAATDYVDVDKGEYGDYITGIVPIGDRLVIFKSNSAYALYGFDSDSFQLINITKNVGSMPLSSPCSSPYGVFCWSSSDGVYLYDGNSFKYVFDKMKPAIDAGNIELTNPPQLAWANGKLYVTVDWTESGVTTKKVLVYDPTLGERGAWTFTDIDAQPLYAFRPPNGGETLFGGCVANTGSLIAIDDDEDRVYDQYLGSTQVHIDSYFVTPWIATRNPVVKKRFGKPRMVTLAESTITLGIEVYKDYDMSNISKEFSLVTTGRSSSSVWDTMEWQKLGSESGDDGNAIWGQESDSVITDIKRLPTLGTARAISMKIKGPSQTNNKWAVNALAFTYLPRRLR